MGTLLDRVAAIGSNPSGASTTLSFTFADAPYLLSGCRSVVVHRGVTIVCSTAAAEATEAEPTEKGSRRRLKQKERAGAVSRRGKELRVLYAWPAVALESGI
ncbi:hypothetical protein ABZP36_036116 [Zizania latifolia]